VVTEEPWEPAAIRTVLGNCRKVVEHFTLTGSRVAELIGETAPRVDDVLADNSPVAFERAIQIASALGLTDTQALDEEFSIGMSHARLALHLSGLSPTHHPPAEGVRYGVVDLDLSGGSEFL